MVWRALFGGLRTVPVEANRFGAPLALELGQLDILVRDLTEVEIAVTIPARFVDSVPLDGIVGTQGEVLSTRRIKSV